MRASGSQGTEPIGNALGGWPVQLAKNVGSATLPWTCVGTRVVESSSSEAYQTYAHTKEWDLFRGLFQLLTYVSTVLISYYSDIHDLLFSTLFGLFPFSNFQFLLYYLKPFLMYCKIFTPASTKSYMKNDQVEQDA